MTRRVDWPERLAAFLESRRGAPKCWGSNDCGLFCADAIEAMTGVDPGWELRGTYQNARQALRALVKYFRKRGLPMPAWQQQPDSLLGEIAQHAASIYGWPAIELLAAQRGDLVLLEVGDLLQETSPSAPRPDRGGHVVRSGHATLSVAWTRVLGIIGMNGLPVTSGEKGVTELPSERIVRAWRI